MKPAVLTRNRQRCWRVQSPFGAGHCPLDPCRLGFRLEAVGIILVNDTEIAVYNEQFHHTAGRRMWLSFEYGDGTAELHHLSRSAPSPRPGCTAPRRRVNWCSILSPPASIFMAMTDLTPARPTDASRPNGPPEESGAGVPVVRVV